MISTGINKLDEILDGGIKSGLITDIFGNAGTGKTQLAMQISINSVIAGGTVYFHDTTGEFRPERILELINSKNLDFSLLDKIKVARITNVSEQRKHIENFPEDNDISLLVIDNVTDLFSYEYSKNSHYLEKNLGFMNYMHDLSSLAIKNKIPIILTNITRYDGHLESENLSDAINFFTHVKIRLSKEESKFYGDVLTIFKKSKFPFQISPKGLTDLPQSI